MSKSGFWSVAFYLTVAALIAAFYSVLPPEMVKPVLIGIAIWIVTSFYLHYR